MGSRELKHAAKLQEWGARIIECRGSGKCVAEWCSENSINVKTYYYWEKQYLIKCSKNMLSTGSNSLVRIEPDKLPSVEPNNNTHISVITLTAGKVKLELPISICAEQVAALVAAINRDV